MVDYFVNSVIAYEHMFIIGNKVSEGKYHL